MTITMNYELVALLGITTLCIGYLALDRLLSFRAVAVSYANADSALERMKDWATWLTGIQTGAIASMALLAKGENRFLPLNPEQHFAAFHAVVFMGLSVLLSTWVLSCLPSIQLRLKHAGSSTETTDNDIFEMHIFSWIPIRLGRFSGLYHFLCILGFVFFGTYVYLLLPAMRNVQQ